MKPRQPAVHFPLTGAYHQRTLAMLCYLIQTDPQLCFTDFVETAHALGFKVLNHWDPETNLPALVPLH